MRQSGKYYLLELAAAVIIIVCLPCLVQAQDPGPGPDVPIDGGLSLLIAAGVGYGIKKYRNERKKNAEK